MKHEIFKKTVSQLAESKLNVEITMKNGEVFVFENGNNGDIFFNCCSTGAIYIANSYSETMKKPLLEAIKKFVKNFNADEIIDVDVWKSI